MPDHSFTRSLFLGAASSTTHRSVLLISRERSLTTRARDSLYSDGYLSFALSPSVKDCPDSDIDLTRSLDRAPETPRCA